MSNKAFIDKYQTRLRRTIKVRDYLQSLIQEIKVNIIVANIHRKRDGVLDWFYWTFLILKMKRNLRSTENQLETFVLFRLKVKSAVFREQYLIRDLKAELKAENYEECARIRDLINKKKPES